MKIIFNLKKSFHDLLTENSTMAMAMDWFKSNPDKPKSENPFLNKTKYSSSYNHEDEKTKHLYDPEQGSLTGRILKSEPVQIRVKSTMEEHRRKIENMLSGPKHPRESITDKITRQKDEQTFAKKAALSPDASRYSMELRKSHREKGRI
jgi:hypothetical protein